MSVMAAPSGRPRGPRRWLRPLAFTLTAVLLLCCCGGGITSSYLLGGLGNERRSDAFSFACGRQNAAVNPSGELPRLSSLSDEQVRNAAIIVQVGQQLGVPARGWVIAVATAMQESWLRNIEWGDRDSLGLFQQRPSAGWGTHDQIMDPVYSSRKFYEGLLKVPGWEQLALTVAAQAVQISAFPDAYAKHEPLATQLVNLLTDGAGRGIGSLVNLRCVASGEIAASGWTSPIKAQPGSGFRTRDRRDHYGVDFSAPRYTEIYAAAAGVVATVLCNVNGSSNTTGAGCETDGSPSVGGCGWYVDIDHVGGVMTRYCHMQERPRVVVGQYVAPGQVIGVVGSTGNSSGPHLHFEVHTGGGRGNNSAVDPIQFMREVGAPLDGTPPDGAR